MPFDRDVPRDRGLDMNGWSRYEKLVLEKLDTLERNVGALHEAQVLLRIDVARLKVKSGLWGGIAGFIPAVIGVTLVILTGSPTP